MAMMGRLIVFLSCSITSRTRVARVTASSSPTSPCRAQGKRPCGSGTTQRNLACSLPSDASPVSTDLGSPCIGDDRGTTPFLARQHIRSSVFLVRSIRCPECAELFGIPLLRRIELRNSVAIECYLRTPMHRRNALRSEMPDSVGNLRRVVVHERIGQARRVSLLPAMNCPDECAIARVEFFD